MNDEDKKFMDEIAKRDIAILLDCASQSVNGQISMKKLNDLVLRLNDNRIKLLEFLIEKEKKEAIKNKLLDF